MSRMDTKWIGRFLGMAEHVASWSKDPSTKVGAVIVDADNRIVSVGYNGFPVGIDDSPERLADRELKYKMTLHAEDNAILFAQRRLAGCSIYVWPFCACPSCAAKIIQSGITRVYTPTAVHERWGEQFQLSRAMFREAGVELIVMDELEQRDAA